MKWPSHHVNGIQNQKVNPVWNLHQCEFSHVNTPLSTARGNKSKDMYFSTLNLIVISFLLLLLLFPQALEPKMNFFKLISMYFNTSKLIANITIQGLCRVFWNIFIQIWDTILTLDLAHFFKSRQNLLNIAYLSLVQSWMEITPRVK